MTDYDVKISKRVGIVYGSASAVAWYLRPVGHALESQRF